MGEFSDDEGLADFDLDGAIAASAATGAVGRTGGIAAAKRLPPSESNDAGGDVNHPEDNTSSSSKRFKTAEEDKIDSNSEEKQGADMSADEPTPTIVPDQFKTEMTNALETHFGHSTFRPGQLEVLHSILGGNNIIGGSGGGKDTCVFWATG